MTQSLPGSNTRPTLQVVILGAGPAGMSCANVLTSFGLAPIVIERAGRIGGIQRGNFHLNLWMLGLPGETGQEITERMARHYFDLHVPTHLDAEVHAVARTPTGFLLRVTTPRGEMDIEAAAIVIATGMHPRATPELEALRASSERVIIGPLSEVIRDDIRDSRVLILGGGDNALDHALYLAERGNRVTVCARRGLSARRRFIQACQASAAITLRETCAPSSLVAGEDGMLAEWRQGREEFDWLLVMYGYRPNTEVLASFAADIRPRLTESGHVLVDGSQRTNVARVYAAGDVIDNIQPSVATAIAQGLAAARAIELDGPESNS